VHRLFDALFVLGSQASLPAPLPGVPLLRRAIAAHQHGFHVLAGDFNTLAPGEQLEVGRLPRRLRPFVWLRISGPVCK